LSARPRLFATNCTKCGLATEVPFQPTDGRPVYCRECFRKMKEEMTTDPKSLWSCRKRLGRLPAAEHRRGARSEDGCSQRLGVLNATRVQT
jgi:CxxC-x17-CxxC domain-containing protein